MPPPTGPKRPSPEELARRIAARLAESGQPPAKRTSLRDSVVMGRLMSGLIVLGSAAFLFFGIYAGVDLLVGPPSVEPAQVLSAEVSNEGDSATTTVELIEARIEDFIGLVATSGTTTSGHLSTFGPVVGSIGVRLPPASTTTTSNPASDTAPPTTSPTQVTTTRPSITSTSAGFITTTSTSLGTLPGPFDPLTTTTVTAPTTTGTPTTTAPTTTTLPTTTTIDVTTTTLIGESATTCGNNGNGKGNC